LNTSTRFFEESRKEIAVKVHRDSRGLTMISRSRRMLYLYAYSCGVSPVPLRDTKKMIMR
ncbi:unnamed protein product, partial [Amoebophrya sp. A25]